MLTTERVLCTTDSVNIYKQLYSTAMSSSVSVVVAGIVIQNTARGTSPCYLYAQYTSLVTLH